MGTVLGWMKANKTVVVLVAAAILVAVGTWIGSQLAGPVVPNETQATVADTMATHQLQVSVDSARAEFKAVETSFAAQMVSLQAQIRGVQSTISSGAGNANVEVLLDSLGKVIGLKASGSGSGSGQASAELQAKLDASQEEITGLHHQVTSLNDRLERSSLTLDMTRSSLTQAQAAVDGMAGKLNRSWDIAVGVGYGYGGENWRPWAAIDGGWKVIGPLRAVGRVETDPFVLGDSWKYQAGVGVKF